MYARVKTVGGKFDYLQIVESERVNGQPRQRLVLYVGHYSSVEDALRFMPREVRNMRAKATKLRKRAAEEGRALPNPYRERDLAEAEKVRADADALAARLGKLRALVEEHPNLVKTA